MVHKIVYSLLVFIICISVAFVMYLNGRDNPNDFYYLQLSGESSHWKLTDYQIEITPDNMSSGNGKLYFKSKNGNYTTQYYAFKMRAIINNEETSLHGQIVSGPEDFKTGVNIGSYKGPTLITKSGDPITLKDVDEIYAVIQWEEKGNGKTREEIISLYSNRAQ